MKKLFILFFLSNAGVLSAQQKDYTIRAVNITAVKLSDMFWLLRMKTNHAVTIPASFGGCECTGRVKYFEMAAGRSGRFGTISLSMIRTFTRRSKTLVLPLQMCIGIGVLPVSKHLHRITERTSVRRNRR